ncbi:MAG: thioredoxin domain-containing protein [Kiritimatiellae bacterium]|nr:thioredoxin domain-containing protein [Kiritimatiellia bacterium]
MNDGPHPPQNRLAREASAYLRQHAHQPVHWYPWGEEAFEAARQQDRPMLLSIGYAACHWCHVMSHECFENPAIAELINRYYVPVKVDREERPDVDATYMRFVVIATGAGGWPLTVWLTPDREPFFGGTYFPPVPRHGQPGFAELLVTLADLWRTDRLRVLAAAAEAVRALRESAAIPVPGDAVTNWVESAAAAAERQLLALADLRHGGLGTAPKFPQAPALRFLLERHRRTGHTASREAVIHALRAMAAGGIRDHLGGGFHRYAVDEQWHVPHFEKMLTDQALIAELYLEAYRQFADPTYAEIAQETALFIARELAGPDGRLWAALDADSPRAGDPHHSEEGSFYTWTLAEVRQTLPPELLTLAAAAWDLREEGNVRGAVQGPLAGRNVLHVVRTVEQLAREHAMDSSEVARRLEMARQMLLERRAQRPRPFADDLTLAGWSGLAISALARVGALLDLPAAVVAARRAAEWILRHLWDPAEPRLWRCWRGPHAGIPGFPEDYAAVVRALLDLYEADQEPSWLQHAVAVQQAMDRRCWDDATGTYQVRDLTDSPPVAVGEGDELTQPSATALAAGNLLRLWLMLEADAWRERFDALLAAAAPRVVAHPMAHPALLTAAAARTEALRVVIAGPPEDETTRALLRAARLAAPPLSAVLHTDGRSPPPSPLDAAAWPRLRPGGARAAAIVCAGHVCEPPICVPAELTARLAQLPQTPRT